MEPIVAEVQRCLDSLSTSGGGCGVGVGLGWGYGIGYGSRYINTESHFADPLAKPKVRAWSAPYLLDRCFVFFRPS